MFIPPIIDQTKPREEVEEKEETMTEKGEGINQTQPRWKGEETTETEGNEGGEE